MTGNEVDFRTVNKDLVFRRLNAQDIGDVVRRNGVAVRLEGDKSFCVADS